MMAKRSKRGEEDILMNEFGDRYLGYRISTRKLIPGIY
jgi:protein-S-isoprenylcysteine O-methyltransferase Ste14